MKLITVVLLLFLIDCSYAQKTIKVTYEQVNFYADNFFDAMPENEREIIKKQFITPRLLQLTNNGDYSIYESVTSNNITIPSTANNSKNEQNRGTNVVIPQIWVLKNFNSQKSYKLNTIENLDYYIENDFPENDLIYSKIEKTIDTYNCKLAYSISKNNSNDTIKYWYTEEIPVLDAPFIMNKAPGLVLRYETKKGVIYATKIEFFDKKLVVEPLHKKINILSEDEFARLKKELSKSKTYTDDKGVTHSVETRTYKTK
jgi:GLPGLI family protein